MMIVMAVFSFFSFLGVLTFSTGAIVSGLFYGFLYFYLCVVLYSLFCILREENERGFTAQYQPPASAPTGKV
jgi:hypothetical protein